jgi:hypothetical protein
VMRKYWERSWDPRPGRVVRFTPDLWYRWWDRRLTPDPKVSDLKAGIDQMRQAFAALDVHAMKWEPAQGRDLTWLRDLLDKTIASQSDASDEHGR